MLRVGDSDAMGGGFKCYGWGISMVGVGITMLGVGDSDAMGGGFRFYEWGNQMLGAGNSDATGGIQILWVAGGGFRC